MYTTEKVFHYYSTPTWKTAGLLTRVPEIVVVTGTEFVGNRTRGGNSLPGYADIIRRRGNATTDRSVTFHNVHGESAFWLASRYGVTTNGVRKPITAVGSSTIAANFNGLYLPGAVAQTEVDSVASEAAIQFRKKCEERVVTFGGPVFLGELRETINFLKAPIPQIIRHSRKLYREVERMVRRMPRSRRRTRRGQEILTERAQDHWLAYKMAILPLISDIESAIEAVKSYDKVVKLPVATHARRLVYIDQSATQLLGGTRFNTRTAHASCYIKGALYAAAVPPPGSLDRLQQITAMDFRGVVEGFASTVWNLIPLSFVADYFSNIGDIINMELTAGPELAWQSTSTVVERRRFGSLICAQPQMPGGSWEPKAPINYVRSNGFVDHTEKVINRSNDLPEVRFVVNLPHGDQYITIASLLKAASRLEKLIRS